MNVRRGAVLLVLFVFGLLACRQGGEGREPLVPPIAPSYRAIGAPWPPAVVTGVIGRGVAPVRATPAPLAGADLWPPVAVDRVWSVPPDDGAEGDVALAVVAGAIGETLAVELIEVDSGRVRWHDVAGCQAPVVHVTADAIVCADARGMRGLDVATGAPRWQQPFRFGGAEGGLVVGRFEGDAQVAVVDAATGDVVAETAPPPGILAIDVRRACPVPGGFELWAWSLDGALSRFVVAGTSAGPAETMRLARAPARVEACADPVLVELPIAGSIERDLLAVSRAPVAVMGGPVVERGFWRRDGGEIGVATAQGIEVRGGALELLRLVSDAQVGRELAARGTRRLVRGAGGVAVLLDDDRPVAYLSAPANVDSAVLGHRFVLGGGWLAPARTFADRVQRFALPEARGIAAVPPILPRDPPDPPVESRDLPAEVPSPEGGLDLPGAGAHGVGVVFVDPADPALVYAAPLEEQPSAQRGAGIAALDLRARLWRWHAPDGCPPGMPVAVAVARDVIVCGSRGSVPGRGAVRAISRGGTVLWTWRGITVDAVAAGGDLVVVTAGRDAHLLDAATGTALGVWTSDDGFTPRVVPVRVRDTDVLVGVERGAVVARLPRAGMLPLWSLAVEGLAVAVGVAGERVTVELASGELYVVEPGSGDAVAVAGWGHRWRAVAGSDLVLAEPPAPPGGEWQILGYGVDGAPRFAAGLAIERPWVVGARGADPAAPLALAYGPATRRVAVVDPRTGEVRSRVSLPARAVPGAAFATVVDGTPVSGAILARPLGAVLF